MTLSGLQGQAPIDRQVYLTPLDNDFTQPADGYCGQGGECRGGNVVPGRYTALALPGNFEREGLHDPAVRGRLAAWTREVELHAGENNGIQLTAVPLDALEDVAVGP